ncbi:MAG: hypothetical protein KJ726_00280 [Verrucomicrobia bacterium]|nr:hypothetical protein [Verrucomicrobiota bacterium]MBU1908467.1 hypothetical protein [Verrucomicrobiota bacterium]
MKRAIRPSSLLVLCQDTGSANALAAFLVSSNRARGVYFLVCRESVRAVFERQNIKPSSVFRDELSVAELEDLLERPRPAVVLLGSSLDLWTERRCCELARGRIPCVSLVDWWSNFGRRFSSPETLDLRYLPDRVGVLDEDSRAGCVAEGVPETALTVTGNPYWDRLLGISEQANSAARGQARARLGLPESAAVALLVSSDIRNLPLRLGYTEADFFSALAPLPPRAGDGRDVVWLVKPHPRESVEDTRRLMASHHIDARLLADATGEEAVVAADYVIGMCSSLLLEAALLKKRILSVQPGMNPASFRYFSIFKRLGIPTVTRTAEVRPLVQRLVSDEGPVPDLSKLPPPIGDGRAAARIDAVLDGFHGRGPVAKSALLKETV